MQYYLIDESEIQTASNNGIVAVWLQEYNRPAVVVADESTGVFGDHDTVDVEEEILV